MGGMLLLMGSVMLLDTLNILPNDGDYSSIFFSMLFLAGGAIFLMHFLQNSPENWWAVIPGCVLFGLGLLIFCGNFFPDITDLIGGGIFLGSIAVAFWIIYFLDQDGYWWALIPAGTISTLALIAIVPISNIIPAEFLFFFGLSATFALIAGLVKPKESYRWAWIPSGILFAIALIVGMSSDRLLMAFPVLLISLGILILVFPFLSKRIQRGHDE
jgi:hypothetical protein